MSVDSSALLLSGERDLAEEITAAVDEISSLVQPVFNLMMEEVESLEESCACCVL